MAPGTAPRLWTRRRSKCPIPHPDPPASGSSGSRALAGAPRPAIPNVYQSPVRLQLIDLAGRLVAEIENQARGAGVWHAGWNGVTSSGARAAPGIYLVRLQVDGRLIGQRKVTLLE